MEEISFRRKEQAVTLASKSSVKINGEGVQFDPQVLFQRLALAGHGHIDDAFDYELCVFPPALAESPDLLHKPQKANLQIQFGLTSQTKMLKFQSQHNM